MLTIKSYTDLEQSRKLAEILPIESADMLYYCNKSNNTLISQNPFVRSFKETDTFSYLHCWSLAVLLDVIPKEIFDGEYVINITEGCDNRWVLTYDYCENRHHSYFGLSTGADNLVDACYEIILKLNELKLL